MVFTSKLVCDGMEVAGQTKTSGMIPISSKKYSKIDHDTGGVTWEGNASADSTINDTIPPGGKLEFEWTKDGEPHPDYRKHEETNSTDEEKKRSFKRPDDDSITDWKQTVTTADGKSTVYSGNIKQSGNLQLGNSWSFFPLSELFGRPYRIPDLAPTFGEAELTIYTAVNLEIYLKSNPQGFLGGAWQPGQHLDELGVSVVQGQAPGMEGIYWSVSEFVFDPFSATGWVPAMGPAGWLNSADFQAQFGAITIVAAHEKDERVEIFSDSFEAGNTSSWSTSASSLNSCQTEDCKASDSCIGEPCF